MKSSTARNISQLNSNNDEYEPLLDDCEGDARDYVVVVDSGHDEPQPKRSARRSEVLRRMQEQVDTLQSGVDVTVRKRKAKLTFYAALGVTALTSALAAPGVGLYYFWGYLKTLFKNSDAGYGGYLTQLDKDQEQLLDAQAKLQKESHGLEVLRSKRDKILMPYYEQWWHYDENNTNCIEMNDPHPELGEAEFKQIREGLKHPQNYFFLNNPGSVSDPARCDEIMRKGQDVEHQQDVLLGNIDWREYDVKQSQDIINNIQKYVAYTEGRLKEIDEDATVIASAAVSATSIFVLAAIGIMIWGGAKIATSKWRQFMDERTHLQSVGNNIQADLLADLNRLPVSLQLQATVSLGDLSQELALRIDEAELRARKRASFLFGKKCSQAGLFNFLNTPGSKETTKMIFEYADLLPRP